MHHVSTPTCVLGVGLIGGSLMRDLAAAGAPTFGWNRSAGTADAAGAEGFDVCTDLDGVLARAQEEKALLVIGVPMFAVGGLLDRIAELAPDCGITDVVSVKAAVQAEIDARGMADRYVGAHPMAGSAESGWDATRTGLYDGAAWVVCYDRAARAVAAGEDVPEEWIGVFRDVVALGHLVKSEIVPALADTHDEAVARISHMPHLLAYALAVVGEEGGPLTLSLAAGSFRDGTRVAAAEPSMVRSWCENNAEPVVGALDEAIAQLRGARDELARIGTVEDLPARGRSSRSTYEDRRRGPRPVMKVTVGADGWVGELARAEERGGRIDIFG